MPYKSDAQRKYFHAKEGTGPGQIPPKVVKEFDKASKAVPEKTSKNNGFQKSGGRWTR